MEVTEWHFKFITCVLTEELALERGQCRFAWILLGTAYEGDTEWIGHGMRRDRWRA